jgi:5,5'-dehydrodivanillate O-demethylase
MSEELTLYRGESGAAFLLGPRCAHRRTRLWTGWVEEDCIRCLYHGWKYEGSGQCVEQPAEDPEFARTIRVPSYPVHEYLGLIYAYVGEGDPPPVPRFTFAETGGLVTVSSYIRECNYFYNVENGPDPIHASFTHRQAVRGVPRIEAEESEFGITVRADRPTGDVSIFRWGFPNINLRPPTDRLASSSGDVAYRVPIDDDRHMGYVVIVVDVEGEERERFLERRRQLGEKAKAMGSPWELAQAVFRGEITIDELTDHPDIFNIEDNTTQCGQMPVDQRQYERHGKSDVGVLLLRRIYEREMRALAEGRPLKAWRLTESLAPRWQRVGAGA